MAIIFLLLAGSRHTLRTVPLLPRALRRRLLVVDVQGGGPELPGLQGVAEGAVVEEAAAGRVDEDGFLGHLRDLLGPDHAPCLVAYR